ncbi:MAG: tyrosine-type recombinase/integrase [Saprospiraceae bacterium]
MNNHMTLRDNALATRVNYIRGVRHLMLTLNRLPESCDLNQIKGFLVNLRNTGQLSSSSINLRVCGSKYYFRHVVNRLDLVVGIPNPRIAKYQTEVLDNEEIKRLFRVCKDMRQLLIIQLLFDTGLRSRELLKLELKDFNKAQRTITINNAKGQKMRIVPYGEHIRTTMSQYIKMLGYWPQGTLIESYKNKGQSLSLSGLQNIVREIVKRSGLKKRIHPHTLRHTFAVHFLNNGGRLPQLQRLLGHGNITTTLHYLKYSHQVFVKTSSPLDILMDS